MVGKRVVCVGSSSESRAPKEYQDPLPSGVVKIQADSYSEEKSHSVSLLVLDGLKRTASPHSNQLVSISNFASTGGRGLELCQVLQSLTVGFLFLSVTIVLAMAWSLIP